MDENNRNEFTPEGYNGGSYNADEAGKNEFAPEGYEGGGYNQNSPYMNGYAAPTEPQPQRHSMGFAIASLVLGIFAIICCCFWYISGILAILSIVFGVIAIKNKAGRGMGIAGVILSAISLISTILILIFSIYISSHPDEFIQEYLDALEESGASQEQIDEFRDYLDEYLDTSDDDYNL